MPHRHSPPGAQVSASVASHWMQVSPAAPHFEGTRALQTRPSQQPLGQETASQTQCPARQRCPAPQAGEPIPHSQVPAAEQRSALPASQAMQTDPAAPHAVAERTLQVEPEQQPLEQVVLVQPLQAPVGQDSVPGHCSQVAPAAPHLELFLPLRQLCPSQQPGQEPESHTHVPPEQRRPGPQLGWLPHWHCPLAAQLFACVASQEVQPEPAEPQLAKERVRQVVPSQQPAAHELASQTQLPNWQRWPGPQGRPEPHRQAPAAEQVSALFWSQWMHAAARTPQLAGAGSLQTSP